MATSRTRVGRTMLLTAALVLLPLRAFVLVLCLDSYAAWRQFRLTAVEYIAPQLEWMRAALTGIQPLHGSFSSRRRTRRGSQSVAALRVTEVLTGAKATGSSPSRMTSW